MAGPIGKPAMGVGGGEPPAPAIGEEGDSDEVGMHLETMFSALKSGRTQAASAAFKAAVSACSDYDEQVEDNAAESSGGLPGM